MKVRVQNRINLSFYFKMDKSKTIQEHNFWWSTRVYDDKGYNSLFNYSEPKYSRKGFIDFQFTNKLDIR